MKATELLKKDHHAINALFDQYEKARGDDVKTEVFRRLKQELDLHSQIEQEVFYPALQMRPGVREALEEHHVVDGLLSELADMSVDAQFDAKMKVLRENVEHHMKEEEHVLFADAKKHLSPQRLEELGVLLEEHRRLLEKSPIP